MPPRPGSARRGRGPGGSDRLLAIGARLAHRAARLVASRPDVVILAAHIPDGEAFRRAMIAANVHVGALIGSTMAQCVGDFGEELGADAVGVFASDRPTGGFNPDALPPAARDLYERFAAVWAKANGSGQPSEEGLAGFTAAWALFHDVLPNAASARSRLDRRRSTRRQPARWQPPERLGPALLERPGPARPERAGRGGRLAVAAGDAGGERRPRSAGATTTATERDGLACPVRQRADRSIARAAAAMTALAAPGPTARPRAGLAAPAEPWPRPGPRRSRWRSAGRSSERRALDGVTEGLVFGVALACRGPARRLRPPCRGRARWPPDSRRAARSSPFRSRLAGRSRRSCSATRPHSRRGCGHDARRHGRGARSARLALALDRRGGRRRDGLAASRACSSP